MKKAVLLYTHSTFKMQEDAVKIFEETLQITGRQLIAITALLQDKRGIKL